MKEISSASLLVSGAAVPAAIYGLLYWKSPRFRTFVRNNDPRRLTLLQSSRIVGPLLFGYQYAQGKIPKEFGLTTAWCDLLAGATAPLAANSRSLRTLRIWNWLGMAAELVSGASGVLTSPTRAGVLAGWKTSQPAVCFPLVLVPTVFGPVTFWFHLMALTALYNREKVSGNY